MENVETLQSIQLRGAIFCMFLVIGIVIEIVVIIMLRSIFSQCGSEMVQNRSGMVPDTSGAALEKYIYVYLFVKNERQNNTKNHKTETNLAKN